MTRFTRLSDALDLAESESEYIALQMARKAGKDDWRFWFEFLKHRYPKRYGLKANISLTIERDRNRLLDVVEQIVGEKEFQKVLVALANDGDDSVEEMAGEDTGGNR